LSSRKQAIFSCAAHWDISGTQRFEYISAHDLWFPKRKTNCQRKNDDDIKILGGTESRWGYG
jgi:hypothetical protein